MPRMPVWRQENTKNGIVEIYWPSCYQGEAVSGAILVDSFCKLYDKAHHAVWYMNDLLTYLWLSTGQVVVAVCAAGASFGTKESSITFLYMLQHLPLHTIRGRMQVLLPISMGNDYYQADRAYHPEEINALVDRYEAAVRGYAIHNAVVIGGNCDVWGYDRWMDRIRQDLYEHHRDMFIARFGYHGFTTYIGAEQLRKVSVVDRIGHLHVSSWQIVFRAYVVWLGPARAKL